MASTAAPGAAGAAAAAAAAVFKRARNPYWAGSSKFRRDDRIFRRDLARAQGAKDHTAKPIFTPFTWNILKGDMVQVTQASLVRDPRTGAALQNQYGQTMAQKWNGQQGEVLKVLRKQEQVIIKGVNLTKRVVRVSREKEPNETCANTTPRLAAAAAVAVAVSKRQAL